MCKAPWRDKKEQDIKLFLRTLKLHWEAEHIQSFKQDKGRDNQYMRLLPLKRVIDMCVYMQCTSYQCQVLQFFSRPSAPTPSFETT